MPDVISAHTSPRQAAAAAFAIRPADILRQLIRFREYEFAYFLFPGDTRVRPAFDPAQQQTCSIC